MGSQTQVIFVSMFTPMSHIIERVESLFVHELNLSGNVPGYTEGGSQPNIISLISDKISSSELLVLRARAAE